MGHLDKACCHYLDGAVRRQNLSQGHSSNRCLIYGAAMPIEHTAAEKSISAGGAIRATLECAVFKVHFLFAVLAAAAGKQQEVTTGKTNVQYVSGESDHAN